MILIFNDIAGSEVLLILVFVLIFFGSKSIPGLAKTLGRTIRQVKDASAEIQTEIKKSGNEMKKDLNLDGIIRETAEDIKRPLDQYAQDIDNAVKYQPRKTNSHIPVTNKTEETSEIAETKLDQAPEATTPEKEEKPSENA